MRCVCHCVCVLWFEFVCFGAQRCVMIDLCLVIPTVIDKSMWVVDGDAMVMSVTGHM